MARATTKKRKKKTSFRPVKRRVCIFCSENIEWVDFKDADLLRRFMSDRAKIRARRVTGNCRFHQAQVDRAIKLARELALLPYVQRQVTVRKKGGGRGERGGRSAAAGPPPAPKAPPPPPRAGAEGDGEGGEEAAEAVEPTEGAAPGAGPTSGGEATAAPAGGAEPEAAGAAPAETPDTAPGEER